MSAGSPLLVKLRPGLAESSIKDVPAGVGHGMGHVCGQGRSFGRNQFRGKISVHVAKISDSEDVGLSSILSAEEREKMARFHFPEDRRRYLCAHAMSRLVLGEKLGTSARSLEFEAGAHGKPQLKALHAKGVSGRLPCFNLSHSGDYAVLAVGENVGSVGVDVEQPRKRMEVEALAERFFCGEEYEGLMSLDPSRRQIYFFKLWTRKEAVLKWSGKGLGLGLDTFSAWGGCFEDGEAPIRWLDKKMAGYFGEVRVLTEELEGLAFLSVASRHPGAEIEFLQGMLSPESER